MSTVFIGCASRNFRSGRFGFQPEAIVIHISVGSLQSCDNTFLNPQLPNPVSAHYCVGKAGEVHQYVREDDTAFHAGIVVAPTWSRIKPGINPNYYTIGIEHAGFPDDDWPAAQIAASQALIKDVRSRHPLILADRNHIVMHREIRATKTCPGSKVDMDRLVSGASAPSGAQPFVAQPLNVTTTANLNVRRGAPSTAAPVVRVLPTGTPVATIGFTKQGQSVKNNPKWYQDAQGDFFWAGATDRP